MMLHHAAYALRSIDRMIVAVALALLPTLSAAAPPAAPPTPTLLRPAQVWTAQDQQLHRDWQVLVQGDRVAAVGPIGSFVVPQEARLIDLPQHTLLPGLIDLHAHLFLHPYNETDWDDQVLH